MQANKVILKTLLAGCSAFGDAGQGDEGCMIAPDAAVTAFTVLTTQRGQYSYN